MTQEYMPTTDQVRIEYVGVDPDNVDAVTNADFIAAAMFDRWLAAHDAQIRAEAWDEGFTEGRDLAVSGQPMTRNNPYREQQQ